MRFKVIVTIFFFFIACTSSPSIDDDISHDDDVSFESDISDEDEDESSDFDEIFDGDEIFDVDEVFDGDEIDPLLDSDGDGILDTTEKPRGIPVDTDQDGTPDYLDSDSDNDGIPDSVEGVRDSDGDGAPNYRDIDSDGDSIPDTVESGPHPESPVDSDSDGTPDYLDTDSDNDTVEDMYEGYRDPDKDGVPSYLDADSDGDGISDKDERGDETIPLDTDGDRDHLFDFLDSDSDNDGLGDRDEVYCTNLKKDGRLYVDMDGDGDSDFIEQMVGTDPCDKADVVTEPYIELFRESRVIDITFSPRVRKSDIWLSIDTSSSMDGELSTLKQSLSATLIPTLTTKIPDSAYGLAQFGDSDAVIVQNPTKESTLLQSKIDGLAVSSGTVCEDLGYQMLHNIGTSSEWREKTVPLIVHITDAPSLTDPAPDALFTTLNEKGARVITVFSADGCDSATASTQLTEISTATAGSLPACADGGRATVKYDVDGDGSGLENAIVGGVDMVMKYGVFNLYAQVVDDASSDLKASLYIWKIEAIDS
ncbi:VWA domain-containing protein, partial [bacterium]|nr:VWA domain-containing protein [bacterium]